MSIALLVMFAPLTWRVLWKWPAPRGVESVVSDRAGPWPEPDEAEALPTAPPDESARISFMALAKPVAAPRRAIFDEALPALANDQPRQLPLAVVTATLAPAVAAHPPNRIVATSIGLDAPVVVVHPDVQDVAGEATLVWNVADAAAGWHKGSALPGAVGNIVLSGHHNIKGQVFRYVEQLKPGDEVVLYADGNPYRYVVSVNMIVKEKGEPPEVRQENARWIGPFSDERLTLVTCWPYTSNTHRVIVVARPVGASAPVERPLPPVAPPA